MKICVDYLVLDSLLDDWLKKSKTNGVSRVSWKTFIESEEFQQSPLSPWCSAHQVTFVCSRLVTEILMICSIGGYISLINPIDDLIKSKQIKVLKE